jgi:hypothetical protein
MMNENERDSMDDEFIGSQGWRKELERASSGVKSKFHSSKVALREVGVCAARTL